MTVCVWCLRKLGTNHGFSDKGEPICCSYSNPPTRAYNSCKSRKNRLASKKSSQSETAHSSLGDGIQIMINQLEELIALQKQSLAQPKQIVTETKVISTTTFEAPSDLDDSDIWGDVEIKQDKSTKSATNFLEQMKAMQAGTGAWGKGKEQ